MTTIIVPLYLFARLIFIYITRALPGRNLVSSLIGWGHGPTSNDFGFSSFHFDVRS